MDVNAVSGSPSLVHIFTNVACRLIVREKVIANNGDYVENDCLISEKLLYQIVLFCFFYFNRNK